MPHSKDYEKELVRIQRLIHFHELRGLKFDNNIIPEKPKTITQEHIEELRKIDYHYVESKAQTPISRQPTFEEVKPKRTKHDIFEPKKERYIARRGNVKNLHKGGKKGRKIARKKGVITRPFKEKHTSQLESKATSLSPKATSPTSPTQRTYRMHNIMIKNFRSTLRQYSNAVGAVYVENLLDRLTAHYGEDIVADVISEIGNDVTYETFYDYTANNKFMNEVLDKIKQIAGDETNTEYLENLRDAVNNIDDFGDYQLAQENKYVRAFVYTGYVDTTKQELNRQKYRDIGITTESITLASREKQLDRYIKAVEQGFIVDTNYNGDINSITNNWGVLLDQLDTKNPNWELK